MRPFPLLAAALLMGGAGASLAQDVRTDTYLMQVAAAVSGYSNGAPVWIVICDDTTGTYDVIGGFTTRAQAQESANAAERSGKDCNTEGPYIGGVTYEAATPTFGSGGCKKGPDSDCVADSAMVFRVDQLALVTLTYRLRSGGSVVDTIRPGQVEAIFFTMPAIDRMIIPYYLRTRGLSYTLAKRRQLLSVFRARDAGLQGP
jgi:hypothetical protein